MKKNIPITVALAEIQLIEKKLERKRTDVVNLVVKMRHVPDQYASSGGMAAVLKSEMQAIADLSERLISIRTAILRANIETELSINGVTRSIQGWLTWKREVAEKTKNMLYGMRQKVSSELSMFSKNPPAFKTEDGRVQLAELEINVDQALLDNMYETASDTLEKLDGELSLLNATVMVAV